LALRSEPSYVNRTISPVGLLEMIQVLFKGKVNCDIEIELFQVLEYKKPDKQPCSARLGPKGTRRRHRPANRLNPPVA